MSLDYANEQYVRVYTRDTPGWQQMPWESRCILPLVMRKLDRMGAIDLGSDGLEGLASLIVTPVTVVRDGMNGRDESGRHLRGLLERETFVMRGTVLIMPNFAEAQEVKRTDAERAKVYRERKRANLLDGTNENGPTDPSHAVTPVTFVRDASQNVTLSLAVPVPMLSNTKETTTTALAPLALDVPDSTVGKKPSRKAALRRVVPADWQPSATTLAILAKDEGIRADVVLAAVREFVDYWIGEGKPKADWDATFRNRVRELGRSGRLPSPEVCLGEPRNERGETPAEEEARWRQEAAEAGPEAIDRARRQAVDALSGTTIGRQAILALTSTRTA